MKKILLFGSCLALFACSSPEAQQEKVSESETVEKINKELDKAKSEVKEISKDVENKLDEAIKKIENETE